MVFAEKLLTAFTFLQEHSYSLNVMTSISEEMRLTHSLRRYKSLFSSPFWVLEAIQSSFQVLLNLTDATTYKSVHLKWGPLQQKALESAQVRSENQQALPSVPLETPLEGLCQPPLLPPGL